MLPVVLTAGLSSDSLTGDLDGGITPGGSLASHGPILTRRAQDLRELPGSSLRATNRPAAASPGGRLWPVALH